MHERIISSPTTRAANEKFPDAPIPRRAVDAG
jgi:hypothetical protein